MKPLHRQPAVSIGGDQPAGLVILLWALAWAVIGAAVAAGIVLVSDLELAPALRISVTLAEVVGFSALVSARLIFPLFVRLPYALSLLLQVLTLLSGTAFGSIAVVATYPLLSVRQFRIVGLIVVANALIAVVVGIAIYTYDTMRLQIEASYRTLREKEALERELSIAREVQQQLLPRRFPTISGLELAGVCQPAVGVGGDFYDFLKLSDDQLGLVVADVSGKGIPAALLMAGLQAAVRSLTHRAAAPGPLTERLNDILYASSSAARYATMFLGFYDAVSGTLSYANAGHHPPLLLRSGKSIPLAEGGMPIGLFQGARYADGRVELCEGDLLALFTDGVVEAPNHGDVEFGVERLIRLLGRADTAPLDEVVRRVLSAIKDWSGESSAHDDVTLVLARVTKTTEAPGSTRVTRQGSATMEQT